MTISADLPTKTTANPNLATLNGTATCSQRSAADAGARVVRNHCEADAGVAVPSAVLQRGDGFSAQSQTMLLELGNGVGSSSLTARVTI